MKRDVSAFRAALLWNLSILILGSFGAILLPTIPFLTFWALRFGMVEPPPWSVLRVLQIVQGVVVCLSGGWMTERYFRSRLSFPVEPTARWILRLQVATLGILVACSLGIAVLHYGLPTGDRDLAAGMIISALLLFGSFIPMFMLASRHFWRRCVA